MGKKIYIRGSNYGGEMTIGTVTPEFVTYWQGRDENELIEHLQALEDWDSDGEGIEARCGPCRGSGLLAGGGSSAATGAVRSTRRNAGTYRPADP